MPEKLEPHVDSCFDCRYYFEEPPDPDAPDDDEPTGELDLTGVCRRYPPLILLAYPEPVTRYPDVAGASDWCGEFTPKS